MITSFNYKGQEIKFEITDPEDYLQKFWLRGTFYELGMLQFIEDRWKERAKTEELTFVDVGACIGNHTVFFSKVMGVNVHAFEPWPPNARLIEKNILLNITDDTQVTVWHSAAGEYDCHLPFKLEAGNSGMHKISSDGDQFVHANSLDYFVNALGFKQDIGLIKIDVEGFNMPVLRGAMATIDLHHPEIYIECQTPAELLEVKEFLLPIGYKRWPAHFNATPTYMFYYPG